jgi:hypothetical protein
MIWVLSETELGAGAILEDRDCQSLCKHSLVVIYRDPSRNRMGCVPEKVRQIQSLTSCIRDSRLACCCDYLNLFCRGVHILSFSDSFLEHPTTNNKARRYSRVSAEGHGHERTKDGRCNSIKDHEYEQRPSRQSLHETTCRAPHRYLRTHLQRQSEQHLGERSPRPLSCTKQCCAHSTSAAPSATKAATSAST